MRIAWTDLALDRVEEIALHIADDDHAAALRWTDELFAAVERLADFPESGRLVPELEVSEGRTQPAHRAERPKVSRTATGRPRVLTRGAFGAQRHLHVVAA